MARLIDGKDNGIPAAKLAALAAIIGPALLFAGSALHPMNADPHDTAAAFAEYAGDTYWLWSHAAQLIGVFLMGTAFVALIGSVRGTLATLGRIGISCTMAIAALLQAVDGVAVKAMADRLAVAVEPTKPAVFEAANAVRQMEIGLAATFALVAALTTFCLAIISLQSLNVPKWFIGLGIMSSIGLLLTAATQAQTGFSPLAMAVSMPASLLLLLWTVISGLWLWRGTLKETSFKY